MTQLRPHTAHILNTAEYHGDIPFLPVLLPNIISIPYGSALLEPFIRVTSGANDAPKGNERRNTLGDIEWNK